MKKAARSISLFAMAIIMVISAIGSTAGLTASAATTADTEEVIAVIDAALQDISDYKTNASAISNAILAKNDEWWYNNMAAGIEAALEPYTYGAITYDSETGTAWCKDTNGNTISFFPASSYNAGPDEAAWATAAHFTLDFVDSESLIIDIWRNGDAIQYSIEWINDPTNLKGGHRFTLRDLPDWQDEDFKRLIDSGATSAYEDNIRREYSILDILICGKLGEITEELAARHTETTAPAEAAVTETTITTIVTSEWYTDVHTTEAASIDDNFIKLEATTVADIYYDPLNGYFVIAFGDTLTPTRNLSETIGVLRTLGA